MHTLHIFPSLRIFSSALLLTLFGCGPQTQPEEHATPQPRTEPEIHSGLSQIPPPPTYTDEAPDEPPTATTATEPPEPEPEPHAEPDWKARYAEIKASAAGKFEPIPIGSQITVKLKAGGSETGILNAQNDEGISLEFAEGEIFIQRSDLASETRVRLYEADALHLFAINRLKREKQAWQRQQRERARAERERAAAERARQREREPQAPAPHLVSNEPPVNDPNDNNSVWQVKEYLKNNLRNFENVRFLRWHPVQPHEKGWTVRCVYRTKSGNLGWATERMMFFMDPNGNVYRKAPYKVTPAE